jgi:hypothetical protein
MRTREILTTATQFVFTQNVLPFLVVLGVVVGCRDVRYPRVELSSRNINGIGEVCVGLGPRSSSTRSHTPLSSPYEKIQRNEIVNDTDIGQTGAFASDDDSDATVYPADPEPMSGASLPVEGSATTRMMKMLLRLWRRLMRFFSPSPSRGPKEGVAVAPGNRSGCNDPGMTRHKQRVKGNQSYEDSWAAREYPGYRTLLSLLGKGMHCVGILLRIITSSTLPSDAQHLSVLCCCMRWQLLLPFRTANSHIALMSPLGRKTLRWVGVMDSDRMFQDMYAQYYLHDDNRWASFVIDDELQQVGLVSA